MDYLPLSQKRQFSGNGNKDTNVNDDEDNVLDNHSLIKEVKKK